MISFWTQVRPFLSLNPSDGPPKRFVHRRRVDDHTCRMEQSPQCVARQLLDGLDASDAPAEGPRLRSSGDVARGDIRSDRRESPSVVLCIVWHCSFFLKQQLGVKLNNREVDFMEYDYGYLMKVIIFHAYNA